MNQPQAANLSVLLAQTAAHFPERPGLIHAASSTLRQLATAAPPMLNTAPILGLPTCMSPAVPLSCIAAMTCCERPDRRGTGGTGVLGLYSRHVPKGVWPQPMMQGWSMKSLLAIVMQG